MIVDAFSSNQGPRALPPGVPEIIPHRRPAAADGHGRRDVTARGLAGRRFVVLGTGRLVDAVEADFVARGADVDVVRVHEATLREDLSHALSREADCVLALDDEHDLNLRAVLVVSQLERGVPVVMRAFDPTLADELERGRPGAGFGVRAAYSVAHLAAPALVVAALLGARERNVATLRLGDEYLNVCRLLLPTDKAELGRKRLLAGDTPAEVLAAHGCQVLARRMPGRGWEKPGSEPLAPGEEVLIGGPLLDVLGLVREQSRKARTDRPRAAAGGSRPRRGPIAPAWRRLTQVWASATTLSTRVLLALLVLVTAAVAFAPVQGLSDRFYLWVLTALGNPAPERLVDQPDPVVSAVALLAGGVALGLGISLMSAYFIDRRIGETTLRRAQRLRSHVVVVGLGEVGFRVVELLARLGVPCAVVDTSMSELARHRGKRLGAVPVLHGDLEHSLSAARIETAFSLIAASDGNLVNVEACVRAKRASQGQVRTVARIFDDVNAERGNEAFGVDNQIPAVTVAAPAFVDAAADQESIRTIHCDGWPLIALRWPQGHPVGAGQMRRWHDDDVRLLAVWREGKGASPPEAEAAGLQEEEAGMLVGPPEAMDVVLGDLRRRTGTTESAPLGQSRVA